MQRGKTKQQNVRLLGLLINPRVSVKLVELPQVDMDEECGHFQLKKKEEIHGEPLLTDCAENFFQSARKIAKDMFGEMIRKDVLADAWDRFRWDNGEELMPATIAA